MQEQIEKDLKSALLAGNKQLVETLRGLKNAFQYEAVAQRVKPEELSPEQLQAVAAREVKKRQEAAEMYASANEPGRAEKEMAEKAIIQAYLPTQLSETEVQKIVDTEVAKLETPTQKDMGRIIAAVRARAGAQADGSVIARLVRQSLENK